MEIQLTVAVIGLAGVCLSAYVQYFLGKQNDKNKKAVEIRSQAYLDFLNTVSEIAGSEKHNQDRSVNQSQSLIQAKSRVILIGSNRVAREVHDFFSEYGVLNSDEAFDSFSKIVSAMRSDLTGESSLSSKVITETLFGK